MAKKSSKSVSSSRISKTNRLDSVDKRTGVVKGSVFTKDTSFGIPGEEISKQPTVRTYGNLKAYAGLSGSLQNLTDGTDYLIGGTGITIAKNTNGSMTITAGSISPADTLTMGNGFSPYNSTYNGTSNTSVAIATQTLKGLTYSKFINGLNKSKIKLDRKVLAELAYNNPEVFKSIVKKVQLSIK